MSNRLMNQFQLSLEKKVVSVFARVAIGATGAPTLSAANSKGIVSVTRNSAGLYTFVFGTAASNLDVYVKLLSVHHVFTNTSAPAANSMYVKANNISTFGTSSIQVGFTNFSGVATDPASGEVLNIEFVLGDSGV